MKNRQTNLTQIQSEYKDTFDFKVAIENSYMHVVSKCEEMRATLSSV